MAAAVAWARTPAPNSESPPAMVNEPAAADDVTPAKPKKAAAKKAKHKA
jgi:hypothetical protein